MDEAQVQALQRKTYRIHAFNEREETKSHRAVQHGRGKVDVHRAARMSRDSNRTQVHLNQPRVADIFEDFCRDKLPDDEIYVPPHHQPINPEDEDDVVPDQHAAFGITRATQKTREAAWKDLGLEELMARKPDAKSARGPKLPR